MTIKNSKEGTLRPFFALSWMRFQNVQDDTNSVFIVVSNNPLISISSISSHNPILLIRTLRSINSSVKDLIRRQQLWKLLILIRIINRIIDKILLDRRFILNNRGYFRIRWDLSCLKMFHYLRDHSLFSKHVLADWIWRSSALSGWLSRSWNIDLIGLWVWGFSE